MKFEDVLYLTDTGRRWDGDSVSIRDKALGSKHIVSESFTKWKKEPVPGSLMNMTTTATEFQKRYYFRKSADILKAAEEEVLPYKMMMTFHPQRWTDKPHLWTKELIYQNVKNAGKFLILKMRKN